MRKALLLVTSLGIVSIDRGSATSPDLRVTQSARTRQRRNERVMPSHAAPGAGWSRY